MSEFLYPSRVARLVPRATVTVFATTEVQSTETQASTISGTNSDALSAGWVVAIVSLVILSISLTINVVFYVRRRRARKRGGRIRDRAESVYYDISKPARTYSRRERVHR